MTHCQIILLHHNHDLVYSVLDQFEQTIIDRQHNVNKTCSIIQSKRKLSTFVSQNSEFNYDVSRIIVDFINPPLKISQSYYGNKDKCDISLSFYDHFVDFNHHSLVDFASKNFKNCKLLKTCFIQLFDEKEAKHMSFSTVYGFLTRLYSSAFETSHHIHLFATHKREKGEEEGKANVIKMKSMNVVHGGGGGANNQILFIGGNQSLKNHHLTSFSSLRILSDLLSSIVSFNKQPPMSMYDISGSLSLISNIRLRLNVVKEIKSCIDPLYLAQNQCIGDLVDHIMRSPNKYQSYSQLRTSYVSY